jgi:hypothetical protein
MRDKLTKRGRDGKADILKRAGRAFDEIKKAEMLAKQGKIDILTNHSGEDAKEEWSALQKRVGGIPECYKYGEQNAQFRDEIDNMFRKFLVLIFPEIPTHVCKESLNGGCICGFCGRRYHDIERTEGNYGCGCGSVVEWCRRCHEWERYDEATGLTIKRTDMW